MLRNTATQSTAAAAAAAVRGCDEKMHTYNVYVSTTMLIRDWVGALSVSVEHQNVVPKLETVLLDWENICDAVFCYCGIPKYFLENRSNNQKMLCHIEYLLDNEAPPPKSLNTTSLQLCMGI